MMTFEHHQLRRTAGAMMESSSWRLCLWFLLSTVLLLAQRSDAAFTTIQRIISSSPSPATGTRRRSTLPRSNKFIGGEVEVLLWLYQNNNIDDGSVDMDSDEYDYDNEDDDDEATTLTATKTTAKEKKMPSASRWESLNPKIKQRVVKVAQERAIENKKKREPTQDKKRRMMMFVKEKQKERKNASRVQRLLSFDDRTPLTALIPGMEMTGLVISLTNFGAYVDVGTQCDGLLHISQISRDFFVEHPREVLTPGDEITVQVRSVNASRNKLHLTMLPRDVWIAEKEQQQQLRSNAKNDINSSKSNNNIYDDNDDSSSDRIPLGEIQVDDELWGELRRVTDYGAYVEVGAVVDGWLHFMDHPEAVCHVGGGGLQQGLQQQQSRPKQQHPSDFMKVGDRVRVWVADINNGQQRIKLTALRPSHLPGPRREF